MSVATEHVYRVSSAGWVHCHGNDAQDVPAWPTLQHSALVVLDLDDIFTDVWRFEGKSEYAAALIEKRARTQGLVEGAAHIVMHRLLKVPGGFQAFFSAIPLELWQRCTQWAREQGDHCLLLTAAGLLSHGVGTDGGRILLSQRRLMYFAQTEEGLSFGSMQALGGRESAMADAAQALLGRQQGLWTRLGADAVEYGVLWSVQPEDVEASLHAIQAVLGNAPVVLFAAELDAAGARVLTALPKLAHEGAGRHALNPLGERIAWRAERWVAPVTVVTALAGLVLIAAGALITQQTDGYRSAGQGERAQLETLQSRIQAVSAVETPRKLLPATELARQLDQGIRYNPMTFLLDLKEATGKDMRIQRVRLETEAQNRTRTFRVDGLAASGASYAVMRWVSHMTAAGWTLKALDPVGAAPGAFSYQLIAAGAAPRSEKP